MPIDCLYRKMRTTRRETAMMAYPGAKQILVASNRYDQDFSHCLITLFQCFSRLAFNNFTSIFKIGRRTMITMSRSGNRPWFFRKLSRNILLRRFLWTAFGICFFAIAKPNRGFNPARFPTSIVILASLWRKLFWNTCLKSLACANLSCLGKDSPAWFGTFKASDVLCL